MFALDEDMDTFMNGKDLELPLDRLQFHALAHDGRPLSIEDLDQMPQGSLSIRLEPSKFVNVCCGYLERRAKNENATWMQSLRPMYTSWNLEWCVLTNDGTFLSYKQYGNASHIAVSEMMYAKEVRCYGRSDAQHEGQDAGVEFEIIFEDSTWQFRINPNDTTTPKQIQNQRDNWMWKLSLTSAKSWYPQEFTRNLPEGRSQKMLPRTSKEKLEDRSHFSQHPSRRRSSCVRSF